MHKHNWQSLASFLAKNGFVYQTNRQIGGFKNSWDYGPYGYILKSKIIQAWKNTFINNENTFLMEANHLLNPDTWKISKHLDNFKNLFIDCLNCKKRFQPDEIKTNKNEQKAACPNCKEYQLTDARNFNLLLETNVGSLESRKTTVYLRPELAQGIFGNFKSIIDSMRVQIPFGIGQIGISFRNEITTNSFLFRTRSFQMAELEFFVAQEQEQHFFEYYHKKSVDFLTRTLGLTAIRSVEVLKNDLAHYSKRTIDIEFQFIGETYQELCGIANRGTFDLDAHNQASHSKFSVIHPQDNVRVIPSVIEVSMGMDRLFLAIVSKAYTVEILNNGKVREVFKLPPFLSPFQVAVNSLTKKQIQIADDVHNSLKKTISCLVMHKHSIGKRYRIQDALGVKFNVTVDFQTADDQTVSVRDRDTMKQHRVLIENLLESLKIYD